MTVTFSRDINQSTLSGSSFTLTPLGGTPVAATLGYNTATHTATLTPNAPLADGTDFTATVTTAVQASDGGLLAAPVSWSFRTAGSFYRLFASSLKPEIVHISTANGRGAVPGRSSSA